LKTINYKIAGRCLIYWIFYFFLEAFESENNFIKIQETKKLTTAPITDIIAVNNKSFIPIFKAIDNSMPPTTTYLI